MDIKIIHMKHMRKAMLLFGDNCILQSPDKTQRFKIMCLSEKIEDEAYLESDKLNRAQITIKILKSELTAHDKAPEGYKAWKVTYKGIDYRVVEEGRNGSYDTLLELYCEAYG